MRQRFDMTWFPPEGMQGATKENLEAISRVNARGLEKVRTLTLPVELPGGGRPNSNFRYSFKRGFSGWDVWALQVALNSHQKTFPISEDGIFGAETEECVKREQSNHHVPNDGVIGPVTQGSICASEAKRAEAAYRVPVGLIRGLALGESGLYFAAVAGPNWNNSYDGGVVQDNLTSSEILSVAKWERAFNVRSSFTRTATMLADEFEKFRPRPGIKSDKEGWECAVGNHNWPAAAHKVSYGQFDSWRYYALDAQGYGRFYGVDDPAYWVIAASGGRLSTARQWWRSYIDTKTIYVKDWTP